MVGIALVLYQLNFLQGLCSREVDVGYYFLVSDRAHHEGSLTLLARLKHRGILRVAFSYAVIAWLVLQIGHVVLDPFD